VRRALAGLADQLEARQPGEQLGEFFVTERLGGLKVTTEAPSPGSEQMNYPILNEERDEVSERIVQFVRKTIGAPATF